MHMFVSHANKAILNWIDRERRIETERQRERHPQRERKTFSFGLIFHLLWQCTCLFAMPIKLFGIEMN